MSFTSDLLCLLGELVLLCQVLLHGGRHKLIRGESHGVVGTPLGHTTKRGHVLEHVGQRDLSLDSLQIPTVSQLL